MTVNAVFRHIDRPSLEPAGRGGFPLEDGLPLVSPFEFSGFLGPEFCRAFNRGGMEAFVFSQAFDLGLFAELAGGFNYAIFDEMGFDVFAQGGICRC